MIKYHPLTQALIGIPARAQFVVACASSPVMSLLALDYQGILNVDTACLALQINLGILAVMPFVHAMCRGRWKVQYEKCRSQASLKLLQPNLDEKSRRYLETYLKNLELHHHLALDWIPTYKAIDKIKWGLRLAIAGLRGSRIQVPTKY